MRSLRTCSFLAAAAATFAVLFPGTASAQPASAALSASSDPGDPVGLGQSYYFDPETSTVVYEAFPGPDQRSVRFEVHPPTGEDWTLRFEAPPGQPFTFGDHPAATLGSGTPGAVGLSVSIGGRGCTTVTGSVQILDVQFGEDGSLTGGIFQFHQFCDGVTAELRGEISALIRPDVPPAPITVTADRKATVAAGTATVTVRTTCDISGYGPFTFTLTQRHGNRVVTAGTAFNLGCNSTVEVPFDPAQGNFRPGAATVHIEGYVLDRSTGVPSTASVTRVVQLRR